MLFLKMCTFTVYLYLAIQNALNWVNSLRSLILGEFIFGFDVGDPSSALPQATIWFSMELNEWLFLIIFLGAASLNAFVVVKSGGFIC